MRLLHTSDLHIGASWRGMSRRDDQRRVLGEILGLCDAHAVDALLVTGDVFSDRVEGGKHPQVARRFLEDLSPQLAKGRPVILLRGNHDPLDLFMLMRLFVKEMADGAHWPLVVADLPGVYRVPGHALQVVALPYITPTMLRDGTMPADVAPDQQLPGLAGHLAQKVQHLYRQATPDLPAIFAGHVSVTGAQISEDLRYEAGYHVDLWLDPGLLPQFTSYNALGHIHLGQEIKGTGKPTWYAGAPDRMDLGERAYTPRVLLVETPDTPGGVATVRPIALTTCTPFVQETARGADEVDRLCVSFAAMGGPDPLGRVTVADIPVAARGAVEARIHRAAPRLEVHWALDDAAPVGTVDGDGHDLHDVPAMVADYLARAFAGRDERRQRLMDAFNSLWGDIESGAETGEVAR